MNQKVINKKNNAVIIHAHSLTDDSYSLCGVDIAGDDRGDVAYDGATDTSEKINCQQCIELINYCKTFKANQLSKNQMSLADWGF